MDILDIGRMAVFVDDTGAFFSVWQAGTHPGAGLVNEPGALAWNELDTRNADEAKAFYGAVFGWASRTSESPMMTYTEWQLGERTIGESDLDDLRDVTTLGELACLIAGRCGAAGDNGGSSERGDQP